MKAAARRYLDTGMCVLPAQRDQKRPTIAWKAFQKRLPTLSEVDAWFANSPNAVCILCGEVSGNLEIIDFDACGELFKAWLDRIPSKLRERLVVEATQSGGRHVIYRCESSVSGNFKLAQRKDGDKIVTLIETRGEGGLFLCAPTHGYDLTQGDLRDPPVLTVAERDVLLQAAWDLNEYLPPVQDGPARAATVGPTLAPVAKVDGQATGTTDRPGDDFNSRGDVRAVLGQHGWSLAKAGENEYWRRPGKTSGTSATFKDRVFYVFSSNAAPFEPNHAYSPFSVYALLACGGDFEQAARSLRQLGYGGDCGTDSPTGVDISAIVGQSVDSLADDSDNGLPPIRSLKDLLDSFTGLNPPVIHGLLREGETMNIIAAPKMGKSWLTINLATCIASGLDWLGMTVEQGRVLHIDNELHEPLLSYRYRVVSEALGLPYHLYAGNIDMVSLRGRLMDLESMGQMFRRIEAGYYKLVVIDAFYRTLPRGTDENDNGAIARLYNRIDHYAAHMNCAFVLIHHTSKGNQSGKTVTDVGAGAGSQSRAADTHLVLRPHEEDGIVVLESAVRSWPPMDPRALLRKWPLFIPTEEVDTSSLLGSAKPKSKLKDVALQDFVDRCVAVNDPCSKRSVRYEASQGFGLSERQAYEMLDLATERNRVARIRIGSQMQYVKCRAGVSGDKALWTAALLAHDTDADAQDIAETVGVTERYVRQIRNENKGLTSELETTPAELSSGTGRN